MIVDPTGAVFLTHCDCGMHPERGHTAKPVAKVKAPYKAVPTKMPPR